MWVPEYKIFVVVVVGFELIYKRMYDYFQSGYPGNEKTNLFTLDQTELVRICFNSKMLSCIKVLLSNG